MRGQRHLNLGCRWTAGENLTPEEARQRIAASHDQVLVLDVRGWDEYVGELGHIPGSVLIPVTDLPKRLDELEAYRDKEVIAVCRSGGRSHTAAGILMQAGFKSVASMGGGMTRWKELGFGGS